MAEAEARAELTRIKTHPDKHVAKKAHLDSKMKVFGLLRCSCRAHAHAQTSHPLMDNIEGVPEPLLAMNSTSWIIEKRRYTMQEAMHGEVVSADYTGSKYAAAALLSLPI